jgi:hypothetical protein
LDLERETGFYKTHIQERDFNSIKTGKLNVIIKTSTTDKLRGEIFYYQNIPNEVRDLFPVLIDHNSTSYTIQKIHGITFSYLFVNDALTIQLFQKLLDSLNRLHIIKDTSPHNIYINYVHKIADRYRDYDYSIFQDSHNIYNKLISYFTEYEAKDDGKMGMIHGDPVFTNILLDKNNNIKFIDMRGSLGTTLTMFGDIFYDYGKIYQSLIGYDEILLDKPVGTSYRVGLINYFNDYINKKFGSSTLKHIKMIAASLIFTLLPLHNGDVHKCNKYYSLLYNLDYMRQ